MAFESFSGSTADHSSSTSTPLWVRSPTCTVHGLECGKPHLCQTAHPFLPTLIETLERHGHLHLAEACRNQVSAASPRREREPCSSNSILSAPSRSGMKPNPAFLKRT